MMQFKVSSVKIRNANIKFNINLFITNHEYIMKKYLFLTGFIIISYAFINCTLAGVELGIIGTWEFTNTNTTNLQSNYSATMKINSDDTYSDDISWTGFSKTYHRRLSKADMTKKKITFVDNDTGTIEYTYELTYSTLKLISDSNQWVLYTKQ
jgi:hypothetical protein